MSYLRAPAVTARVGIALGIAIALCFATGLISHLVQHPPSWFYFPSRPVWLYRVTQGTHVISGVAAIPLLLVKLWAVYPNLFKRPLIGSPLRALERGSIAVLVGAVIFELTTGLLNTAQYYPWKFFFPALHYAVAWVAVGSVLVHVAVKLPVIRDAISRPADDPVGERVQHHVSRRVVLGAAWLSAAVAAVAYAGQTVPYLRRVSLLAPRSGEGPQGLPVNRTAAAAGVEQSAIAADYRLTVVAGGKETAFSYADLAAMRRSDAHLPIACVEGWSAMAAWHGFRLVDLLDRVGAGRSHDVRFVSMEKSGLYGTSVLPANFCDDPLTLIALALNGEQLSLDHGYPCRLIAPNRPGVLQTKWVERIEVLDS